MSVYSEYVNANCAPQDFDAPVPVCPECGVLADDQYKQDGEYHEADGEGPFPIYRCLKCGSVQVDWE